MSAFLADTVDVLRRTPTVVSALLAGIPDTWTDTPDVAGGWQPRDVVGHLISAEIDDWIPRAERILE
nr:DinB family protein [Chloroflexota bacterium]